MSKFTTEVRFICESSVGETESKGFDSINTIITQAAPLIFNFDFPIFDEAYRLPLEVKILRHFYTREICEETVGLWKLRLQDRLCSIMPYYNKLYNSELIEFNPMYDVDIERKHLRDNSADEKRVDVANSSTNGFNKRTEKTNGQTAESGWNLHSDTPQGGVNGIDALEGNMYLTDATKNTNSGSNSNENESFGIDKNVESRDSRGSTTVNNTEQYIEMVAGKQGSGSFSRMLEEFRKTFLNIDAMILEELSDLFFGLWG